jgi:membrane protein required for colicin V production
MNVADIAILAVLGLSVLVGLWRGYVSEVLALAVWVCAFWVAWLLGPTLAERFSGSISTPSARILLACAICFITVLVAGAIVTWLVRKLVAGSGLSGTDRLLGMVFGLVRGLALVVLLVLLLGFTPFSRDPWWRESRLLPHFEDGAQWVVARLPGRLSRYLTPDTVPAMPVLPVLPGALPAAPAADAPPAPPLPPSS